MSASKRNFKDFLAFPGKVNEETGIYEFPQLRHKDSMNRVRIWNAYVRLVKDTNRQNSIDWDLLKENQVKIKDVYFTDGDSIDNIIAEAWVETGISNGKITRSVPTYFDENVNKGKANQRNPFQQALIFMRNQYLKNKDKCGDKGSKDSKNDKSKNIKYFPMLAKQYKDAKKYLKFPIYVQPKLDGVRCLAYLTKPNSDYTNVVIYTRAKKDLHHDEIKKAVYPYLDQLYDKKSNQSLYLDGEIYQHGKSLQEISGLSRQDNPEESIQYHVYDCFYPLELNTSFKDRKKQLDVIFDDLREERKNNKEQRVKVDKYHDILQPVETTLIEEKEVEPMMKKYVAKGYEGIILRNVTGTYKAGATKLSTLRSNDLVKLKPKFTDEYEVVGFTDGKRGKDKNAIIWICKTKDKGKEFNVTPKDVTYQERYDLYQDCLKNFDKKYKHRMITIEYEDLSDDNIPQRAKALVFRDYE